MEKQSRFFIIDKDGSLLSGDRIVKKSYWTSWILASMGLLMMGLMWNSLPDTIPLFYSLPWGELRLANKGWLSLLPILSLGFSWLNLSLSKTLWKQDDFLQRVMAIVSLVESSLFMFIMLGIISIML